MTQLLGHIIRLDKALPASVLFPGEAHISVRHRSDQHLRFFRNCAK